MPEYTSFEAARTALDNFGGWQSNGQLRPMTPFERRQAEQLIKDRESQTIERGKAAIATMRKGVKDHGAALVTKYDAAEKLFDQLEDDIEDGTVSTTDIEHALADASMLERELGKQTDAHFTNADDAARDHDPEKFVRELFRKYPPLAREGRVSPWQFDW